MADGGERAIVLRAHSLTKRFGGVTALDGVDFELRAGEIHAVCGENGAGKSTLIKVLSGIHPAGSYEGSFEVGGQAAAFRTIADAEAAGIAVIYQELALVDEMSVAENISLGDEPRRMGFIDWDTIFARAHELMKRFRLDIDPAARVGDLGVGHQQLVEIMKALRKESRILILDEPTASLTDQEVKLLLDILRDLARQGIALIYISHKLDEVFALADRITVLRDGQYIWTRPASETDHGDVVHAMVGREISDYFPRRATTPGEAMLEVESLHVAREKGKPAFLRDISFEARAGEVLGFGGLIGAGRSELMEHLFGCWGHRLAGTVRLLGKELPPDKPHGCLERGLVLVTEDRKRYGLHLLQPITFNLSLSYLDKLTVRGFIDKEAEYKECVEHAEKLNVRAASLEIDAQSLSGGNQQKVVLAKALMTRPSVVLLDEPTRGVDVGARVEIYELINRLTDQGCAVVMVSSDLPELIGMSDRIIMMKEGEVGGEFIAGDVNQEDLMEAAMGHLKAGMAT